VSDETAAASQAAAGAAAAGSRAPWFDGTLDEAGLQALGRELAAQLTPPAFVALRGDLGAGKSVLARAIARALGVTGTMPSPTYNLLLRYPAAEGREVIHLDLYRLAGPDEIFELGWQDLGADHEVVLCEWPERAENELPPSRVEVQLAAVAGEPTLRHVQVQVLGEQPEVRR
jgi:tRNA threonylcarbamoyladenosine biosynthesis protein TsaE